MPPVRHRNGRAPVLSNKCKCRQKPDTGNRTYTRATIASAQLPLGGVFILSNCNLILINICIIYITYLLLARIYEFQWRLTASLCQLGFPAQVCNLQGGRGCCFVMLGCLLPLLSGFSFLYIGRDSLVHKFEGG
jgi:hypothetical protein